MIEIIALLFMIVGVAFLVLATIGVIRFGDPLQRMHASTKAGTVGAGLVLIGTMMLHADAYTTVIGTLALLFLIATVPVAGHLLGRAVYVSGAPLSMSEDALAGVIPRARAPLEERQRAGFAGLAPAMPEVPYGEGPPSAPPVADGDRGEAGEGVSDPRPGFDGVRFAVLAPHAGLVARRARALAAKCHVPLTAVAVLERPGADETVPASREAARARLAEAIAEVRRETAECGVPLSVTFEEGDPLALIPAPPSRRRELLVLPIGGRLDQSADARSPASDEKLFALAERHAGPTLFVGAEVRGAGEVVVLHDGSARLQRLAAWALASRIWPAASVVVVGRAGPEQIAALEAIAADAGVSLASAEAGAGAILPERHRDAIGIVLPGLQRSPGEPWEDRLAPGFKGDVLV